MYSVSSHILHAGIISISLSDPDVSKAMRSWVKGLFLQHFLKKKKKNMMINNYINERSLSTIKTNVNDKKKKFYHKQDEEREKPWIQKTETLTQLKSYK